MGAANIKANKVTISSSLKINTRPLQDSRFSRDPSTSLRFGREMDCADCPY
jgi:hypothetical protein